VHILLVEDEPRIASFVRRGLEEEGHGVDVVGTLAEAREALAQRGPDLLVLDRGLPDGDGLELVRSLRRGGQDLLVIVLTARDAVRDRVDGLMEGADDYVVKPFAFDELVARITALSRRALDTASRVTVGPLVVDLDALRVHVGEREVHLTAQEFRLLRYLAENPGRVMSRTRILEHAWDIHHDPGSNVVDVYISYLRQKLADAGAPALIHTVRGRGWVLEARTS